MGWVQRKQSRRSWRLLAVGVHMLAIANVVGNVMLKKVFLKDNKSKIIHNGIHLFSIHSLYMIATNATWTAKIDMVSTGSCPHSTTSMDSFFPNKGS